MKIRRFTSKSGHKQDAVEVPFDPELEWSISSQTLWYVRSDYRVKCLVNGIGFESVIVRRSGKFFVLIDENIQTESGVSVGDEVTITLESKE